jgi:hypothetical protein
MCVCRQLLAAPARYDPPRFSLRVCTVLLRHHLALIFNRWRACSDLRSAPQLCACSPSPPPHGVLCATPCLATPLLRRIRQRALHPYTPLEEQGGGGEASESFINQELPQNGEGIGLGRFPRAGSASPVSHYDFIEPFVLCQPRCGPRTARPSRLSLSCFPYLVSFPTFIRRLFNPNRVD